MNAIVVVGAGQAGLQIAECLRRGGHSGPLTLLGDERWPPYQRPPLSKKYLGGAVADERLFFRPLDYLAKQEIEFRASTQVVAIDRANTRVLLANGEQLAYAGLALATGARPRMLPVPGADHPAVCYLRGVEDAQGLLVKLAAADRVVVIGGGFIGLEVAATACAAGKTVTVIEASERLLARAVAPIVSQYFADLHRMRGVVLQFGAQVTRLVPQAGGGLRVELNDGTALPADLVLVGVGGLPNQELAAQAGLTCANGIVVDEFARTSDPLIVAAGDCTSHINRRYPTPLRLESVQNAVDQAKIAAFSLLGLAQPYQDLPWFWSDQYDVKLQIAGLSQSHDTAVVRGEAASGAFSVFYFAAGALVAVDSVNRPADHMLVRKLLSASRAVTPEQAADVNFDLKLLL